MPKFRNVWRNLVHRKAVDADLDDELRAAFDLLVIVWPAVAQRVPRVICPFDDFD